MTPRTEATRAKILDAAKALLVEGGAASLTLRAIASAAGVALGNLQYHYATLDVLVAALLHRELDAGKERASAFLSGVDVETSVERVIEILLDDHDDDPLVRTFIGIWSLAAITPTLRPRVHDFYDAWADLIVELLTARLAISKAEARARAMMFLACLEGLSLFRGGIAARKNDPSLRGASRVLLRILFGDDLPVSRSTQRSGRSATRVGTRR